MRSLPIWICMFLLALPIEDAVGCYDVSKGEPRNLSGQLSFKIFAGPPNYEDIQEGDTPEPAYVLTLPAPICLEGDEFADPDFQFDKVQLVATEQTAGKMRAFLGKDVFVDLSDPMPAMTGHHHLPLVAWVSAIANAKDPTEAYGTAATVVEAFYLALGAGDGVTAATFIVPEKTSSGPFSPGELTRFYGSLSEPLHLLDVEPQSTSEFIATYRFVNRGNVCNGKARVSTQSREGRFFISRINALNGC